MLLNGKEQITSRVVTQITNTTLENGGTLYDKIETRYSPINSHVDNAVSGVLMPLAIAAGFCAVFAVANWTAPSQCQSQAQVQSADK
jgi:hypothetical protein